jgi:hypothetical protein
MPIQNRLPNRAFRGLLPSLQWTFEPSLRKAELGPGSVVRLHRHLDIRASAPPLANGRSIDDDASCIIGHNGRLLPRCQDDLTTTYSSSVLEVELTVVKGRYGVRSPQQRASGSERVSAAVDGRVVSSLPDDVFWK